MTLIIIIIIIIIIITIIIIIGDTEVRQRHTDTRLQAEVYNSPRFDKGELFFFFYILTSFLYIPLYSFI